MPPTPAKQKSDATPGQQAAAGFTDYRYMGGHATEMPMDGALPWLAPGDFVTLSDADAAGEKATRLIDEGTLMDLTEIGIAGQSVQLNLEDSDDSSEGGN